MRKIKGFVALTLVMSLMAASLTGCGGSSGKKDTAAATDSNPLKGKKLVMAVNAEYAPFESKNESGTIEGFDVDLNQALADKLGYTFELDDMDFTGLIGSITSKRCDYIISALSSNEKRKKVVDFSQGYYTPVTVILCPKDSGIESSADLKGKKIGVTLGTEFESFSKTIKGAKTITYESIATSIPLIGTSELDACIMDSSNAFEYCNKYDNLTYKVVPMNEIKGVLDNPYCIVLPKNSEYVDIFNKALDELEADGTMEKLQTKWFGKEYTDALKVAEE